MHPSKYADVYSGRVILVDCLTLWLTNYFLELNVFTEPEKSNNNTSTSSNNNDHIDNSLEQALLQIKAEFDKLISQ
jgi:adenosyl cobinamide kinase/adenosyl cobinamide phosphate guanylyltransferase